MSVPLNESTCVCVFDVLICASFGRPWAAGTSQHTRPGACTANVLSLRITTTNPRNTSNDSKHLPAFPPHNRLSNGQQFACAAPKHNPWVSYGGRRLAQSLEAPPAAAESSAAVAAIGSSDSSSGSSDAAAVADLWSAANTTETEVVVLDSFVADGESAPDSNTPAGAAVAQHSGWGKWGSKVHGGGSSGSNGGSSGAGSWGSWSSVSTQSVLMTGRPPAGAGASSVMWLAGMSGGCSSTSSWRSSSKSLTAPLAGCWVPAGMFTEGN